MVVDTHCHLDNEKFTDDVHTLIQNAKNDGIGLFLIPGADPKDLPKAQNLAQAYDEVYFSVGFHPYDCSLFDEAVLHKYISHPKCIAVGECGLDYHRLPDDIHEAEKIKQEQQKVFQAHVEFAQKVQKPLIVHIRNASDDSKKILLEHDAKKVGGVLHCFNADEQLLCLGDHNFYFGIGGVLTFKNAKKLVNILPKIPLEKIVVETDSPYLTPHPYRGTRNEPKYTQLVVEKIAQLLDMSVEKVQKITTNNALELFKGFSSKS